MTEVCVVHVGNVKESFYKEALAEYAKRLSAFCDFSEKEIKESPLSDGMSEKEISAALEKEADAVLSAIPKRAYVVALCVEGKQTTSEGFAKLLERGAQTGGKLCFIIGSSYGLSQRVKAAADERLSFSQMTFPHRLMRVILSEQIYRGFTILAGKQYHK